MSRYTVYSRSNMYLIHYGPLHTIAVPSIKFAFEQILKGQGFATSITTTDYRPTTLLFSCNSYQDAVDNYPEYFI